MCVYVDKYVYLYMHVCIIYIKYFKYFEIKCTFYIRIFYITYVVK